MFSTQQPAWCAELLVRRITGSVGSLPNSWERPQSSAQAFVLQQQFAAAYGEVIGWKCGLPSTTDEGLDKWVLAPLYQRELQQGPACALWPSSRGVARVEPEYAYPLVADVPALDATTAALDLSPAAIDAVLGAPKLAFELIQSRFAGDAGAHFFDQLADGLFNQGLWLGPTVEQGEQAEFALSYSVAAEAPQPLAARHPNMAPRVPIYWLVNFLRRQGVSLRAGQHLITGSFAGVIEVPFDQPVRWQFGTEPAFTLLYRNKTELCNSEELP